MADHIQIGDLSPRIQYSGNGLQTAFGYPFPIFAVADLQAYVDGTPATPDVEFTVAGAGVSDGGTVTFLAPPANGTVITLRRAMAIARTSDFQESGEFRARVINDELDTLTALIQQVNDTAHRALHVGPTDTASQTQLPDKAARAGRFLAFDAGGDPIAATGAIDTLAVSSFMASLLGLADAAAVRTTLGALAQNGDGSALSGIVTGATTAEKANIALNAFRIAVNGGLSVQNMVDGVVDEFEDETGVDTATSTNETYNPTNDYYTNAVSTIIAQATGTKTGNMTFGGGLAAAWDANTSQAIAACAEGAAGASPTGYLGKDWGVGASKTIDRFDVWSSTAGFDTTATATTITLRLYGSNTAPASGTDGTLLFTDSFTNSASQIIKSYTTGITATTDYRYHWLYVTSTTGGVERVGICEVKFYESVVSNMTLVSNAFTALARPGSAFLVVWHETVDAVTLNTDLQAWASIDGGTTWAQAVLSRVASLSGNQQILTGTADVSGQTGTLVKWKIETLNTREQRVCGVSEQWS